jgi:hypothetical protein
VTANITSYTLPSGKFARSDTLSIPYTIKNIGNLKWTFLVESDITKYDSSHALPYMWNSIPYGYSRSSSLTYTIACSDPNGTWNGTLYSFSDQTTYGGWKVWPTTPTSALTPTKISLSSRFAQCDMASCRIFYGYLTDCSNNPLSGKTIQVTVYSGGNSFSYPVQTDAQGYYEYSFTSNSGIYTWASAGFAGDSQYSSSSTGTCYSPANCGGGTCPTTISTNYSIQVVECLNNADCTACKGSGYICSNEICTAASSLPPVTGSITIYPGWNLISIDANLLNAITEDTCGVFSKYFYYLNVETKKWERLSWQQLEGGKAYWLYSDANAACTISFSGYGSVVTSNIPQLKPGYNLIGSTNSSSDINTIKGNCNIGLGPLYWDASTQKWVSSTTLDPKKGYWVYVNSSCQLS